MPISIAPMVGAILFEVAIHERPSKSTNVPPMRDAKDCENEADNQTQG